MDAGAILAQRAIPITKQDDVGTMFEKLSILGKELLLETLPKLIRRNHAYSTSGRRGYFFTKYCPGTRTN